MYELMLLIIGALSGFGLYIIAMMISFKRRTIDIKIKVFNSLIGSWAKMRNFIIANHKEEPIAQEARNQFDEIYGNSQQLIGESILVCENESLTTDINDLNESIYRNNWDILDSNEINIIMDQFKVDVLALVVRMREDIKKNNRLEWQDLIFSISGLCPKRFCPKRIKSELPNEITNDEIPNKIPKNRWRNLKSKFSRKKPKKEEIFPERDWH
ncbi:MAG: hypothetical protein V3S35_01240 [Nitrosomonadaceae bacterium]